MTQASTYGAALEAYTAHVNTDMDRFEDMLDILAELKADIAFNAVTPRSKGRELDFLRDYEDRIANELKSLFNLKFTVEMPADYFGVGVMIPAFGKQSVLDYGRLDKMMRNAPAADQHPEFRALLKKNKEALKASPGIIDFKEGRVSGGFSEMSSVLRIGAIALLGGIKPDELLSGIIHEVGHVFTFLATIHRSRATMLVLNSVAEDQFKVKGGDKLETLKVSLLDAVSSGKLPEGALTEYLKSDGTDATVIMTELNVLATKAAFAPYSDVAGDSKFCKYHMINSEQTADIFVSQMGFGLSLVRFLHKLHEIPKGKSTLVSGELNGEAAMYVHGGINAFRSLSRTIVATVGIAVFVTGLIPIGVVGATVLGLTYMAFEAAVSFYRWVFAHDRSKEHHYYEDIYGDVYTRLKNILNADIRALTELHKNKTISGKLMRARITDTKTSLALLEDLKNETGVTRKLADLFSRESRRLKHHGEFKNMLEAVASNPLYLSSIDLLYNEGK